jgi:ABC-type multidrug transport system ATPase subunit
MGINSPTGENGGSLSGGQRQRVAIARSLIRNAPILCLDEPTAALDAKSENYIRDSLKEIIADKTVLMVTHRRSLLALMDTIYVLEDGQLRNVMEYGGLDTYLQRLEGVAEASIQKEIKDEQQYIVPELINKYVGLADDVLPAREQVVVEAKGQNRSGEPEYVYMPISAPESIYERRADNTRRYNYDGGNTSEGEEVVIKLH